MRGHLALVPALSGEESLCEGAFWAILGLCLITAVGAEAQRAGNKTEGH